MHELADTEHILEVALQRARLAGAQRVTDLHLALGEFSSITEESLLFYWENLSRGTPAEGARLHFRRVPAEWTCLDCAHTFVLDSKTAECPACQGIRIRMIRGNESSLEGIDVE